MKRSAARQRDDELAHREVLLLRGLHDIRREFFVWEAVRAAVLGKLVEAVTKDDRQLAKSANFGLLYGQSAPLRAPAVCREKRDGECLMRH